MLYRRGFVHQEAKSGRKHMKYLKVAHIRPELLLSDKVAIVGASGNLTDSQYGEIIDSHSDVVRFNRSPTLGFENDVGSKTTLRVVNNHVFNNVDISKKGFTNSPKNFVKELKDARILYIGPDLSPWHNRSRNTDPSSDLYLFNYASTPKIKNSFKYSGKGNLIIGTLFTCLCVDAGLKPTLFGFDLEPLPRTHYYENRPKETGAFHNLSQDQKILIDLNNKHLIDVKLKK